MLLMPLLGLDFNNDRDYSHLVRYRSVKTNDSVTEKLIASPRSKLGRKRYTTGV